MWIWTISVFSYVWLDMAYGMISIQLIPQYPVINGSVTLNVIGITEKLLSFLWYKGSNPDGQNQILRYKTGSHSIFPGPRHTSKISSLNNGSLQIKDLQVTDQGNYTVKIETKSGVTNETMTVYAVAYLWLDLAYGISRIELIPQYSVTGGSVALRVTGITENVQSIDWFKGPDTSFQYEILLYDPGSNPTLVHGPQYNDRITPLDLTLHIIDLNTTDQGDYIARIKTENYIHHVNITLNVYEPVTKPNITASTTRPKENDPLTLTCDTSHATIITWTRFGSSISTEAELSRDNRTLTFSSVTRGDSGQYQCQAQNLASKDSSDPYTVTVTYVMDGLQTIQLIPRYPVINGSVILSVTGNSERILNFTWYKGPNTSLVYQILTYIPDDSVPIKQGHLYSPRMSVLHNGSLQIKDLQVTDEGGYIASIQTETSVKEIHVNLTVYDMSEGNTGPSTAVIAGIVCGSVLIIVLILCATYLLYQNYILPSRMALKDPCRSANPPPNKTKEPGRTHGKQEPSETYENVIALGSNYECSYKDLQFKTENVYNEIIR